MKFTFKTTKPTGAYRAFYPSTHHIKLNKVDVGRIDDKKPYAIRFQVIKDDINEDGNPNCVWKWVTLGKKSETLDEAKKWLVDNTDLIVSKHNLYINTR